MRLKLAASFLIITSAAFAQGDRGTITGTITDKTGAVVPNATISIVNQNTQFKSDVGASTTGNYTFANVSVGTYELSVTAMGFKKYVRAGIIVNVGETYRVDATLDVGATSDTVTITAEAPLLKTESGEVSHQVDYTEADQLPLFTTNGGGGATGTGNVRDPLAVLNLLPGATQTSDSVLRINGLPSSSQTIMVEGMDATNGLWKQINQSVQQGTDAIQEVSVQTSNFAAEYGGAGGGYLNFTMKSGTNQYHGTAYDYLVNEALNSGLPFSAKCNVAVGGNNCATNPNSGHIKNPVRRNDYGFTLGGPVRIPKVYNGKDKTFFFFNFEQFRQSTLNASGVQTFPTAAYRAGDFTTAPNAALAFLNATNPASPCTAAAPCIPGQVFDPATRVTSATGVVSETPFQNNIVPLSRQDPVARYLQSLFPLPNVANALINNYNIPAYSNFEHTTIPSIKVDQSLNSKMKLSGYFSSTITNNPNHNGLPQSISPVVPNADRSYTYRINFDDTITPTLLFHVGIGLLYYHHPLAPSVSDFTAKAQAAAANGFDGAPGGKTYTPFAAGTLIPNFSGLNATFNGGTSLGGFFGPSLGSNSLGSAYTDNDVKPTGNTSLTWVRGNHTYKAGFSLVLEGFPQKSSLRAFGLLGFSNNQTENPIEFAATGITFGSGFNYASYLLGLTNNETTSGINDTRLGNHTMSWFVQDSWKVNRKLTLELGLRWDYATLLSEEHGLLSDACFQCINPDLGIKGAIVYGATNKGPLFNNYKYSYGPHIGLAYQLDSKTVFRAGGSIAYSSAPDNAFLSPSVANFYSFASPGQFLPVSQLSSGDTLTAFDRVYPRFDQYPFQTSSTGCGPTFNSPCVNPTEPFVTIAKNGGRLPRIFQYSIGIQREVARNLLVEAAYVGNRGAWFSAPLLDPNGINGLNYGLLNNLTKEGPNGTPLYGATQNLNVLNTGFLAPSGPCATFTAFSILSQQIRNPCVTTLFPGLANPNNVYPGFPVTQSLTQALRPRPQWTGIPNFLGPPMGDTWYDSLQIKVTKRFSHGLSAQGNYTWSKSLDNAVNSNTSYLTPSDPILNDPYQAVHQKQLSGFDRPQAMTISFSYTTPKINSFGGDNMGGKALRYVARDWTVSGVLRYQSGLLLASATSNNALWTNFGYINGVTNFGGTAPLENIVSNTSCLNADPNGHYNPQKTGNSTALNPGHWANQTDPSFGNAAPYYTNCRWQRQPSESISVGRIFRVKEKYQLLIQAQFFNMFNRVFLPTPTIGTSSTLPQCANPYPGYSAPTNTSCTAPGAIPGAQSSGFGFVNTLNGAGTNPRSGQLIARFTF